MYGSYLYRRRLCQKKSMLVLSVAFRAGVLFCGLLKKIGVVFRFLLCLSKDPERSKTYVFDKRKKTLVQKENIGKN